MKAVDGPLNILAVAGAPSLDELERLGVARVSFGSGPMRAALGYLRQIAVQARDQRTYSLMTDVAVPYAEVNRLLARSATGV